MPRTPRPSPLTEQQRIVLATLNDGGPMSHHVLAVEIHTSSEGAARTTASLRRRGLAEKVAGRWQLTDYGRRQLPVF